MSFLTEYLFYKHSICFFNEYLILTVLFVKCWFLFSNNDPNNNCQFKNYFLTIVFEQLSGFEIYYCCILLVNFCFHVCFHFCFYVTPYSTNKMNRNINHTMKNLPTGKILLTQTQKSGNCEAIIIEGFSKKITNLFKKNIDEKTRHVKRAEKCRQEIKLFDYIS